MALTLHYTALGSTILYQTTLCFTILCYAILCCTMFGYTILCSTIPYHTTLCYALQSGNIFYCSMLRILHRAILCYSASYRVYKNIYQWIRFLRCIMCCLTAICCVMLYTVFDIALCCIMLLLLHYTVN